MSSTYDVGRHLEGFIETQVRSGRYDDASGVVRDALKQMEERENRLLWLDASVERGLEDLAAGREHDAEDVFRALKDELAALPSSDVT